MPRISDIFIKNSTVIIVCGGTDNSLRFKGIENKIFMQIKESTVLEWSVRAFFSLFHHPCLRGCNINFLFLCNAADRDKIQKILLTLKRGFSKLPFFFSILESSFSRMSSIDKALRHESVNPGAPVFIHDAARPFIQPQSILKMVSSLLNVNSQYVNSQCWDTSKCAVMAEKPTNSLLFKKDDLNNNFDYQDEICPNNSNKIYPLKIYPLNREKVISIATPFAGIAQRIIENRKNFFDYLEIPGYEDTAVSGLAGMNISFIYQDTPNLKITYPSDFTIMKSLAQELSLSPNCLES